ncbi:hypothetical protein JTB14_027709 [Gonioctena quinquepunctata]|nr:hypothetical protein JTB14_027709 [Gonioctena quinquepunctata]
MKTFLKFTQHRILINQATKSFINILKRAEEKCTNTIKYNSKTCKRSPWITQGLVKSINKKYELFKVMKKHYTQENIEIYKSYRNKLNDLMKQTKKDYYSKKVYENKNNNKTLWDSLNEMIGKKKPRRIIKEIKSDGKIINNPNQIADVFCKKFSGIGKILADNIKSTLNNRASEEPQILERIPNSIVMMMTDETEIVQTIETLKDKKAPGVDGIRSETLKYLKNTISKPLSYIINKAITEGIFPEVFKVGVITPFTRMAATQTH